MPYPSFGVSRGLCPWGVQVLRSANRSLMTSQYTYTQGSLACRNEPWTGNQINSVQLHRLDQAEPIGSLGMPLRQEPIRLAPDTHTRQHPPSTGHAPDSSRHASL